MDENIERGELDINIERYRLFKRLDRIEAMLKQLYDSFEAMRGRTTETIVIEKPTQVQPVITKTIKEEISSRLLPDKKKYGGWYMIDMSACKLKVKDFGIQSVRIPPSHEAGIQVQPGGSFTLIDENTKGFLEDITLLSSSNSFILVYSVDNLEDRYVFEHMHYMGLDVPVNGDFWVCTYDDVNQIYGLKFNANPPKPYNSLKVSIINSSKSVFYIQAKYRIYTVSGG